MRPETVRRLRNAIRRALTFVATQDDRQLCLERIADAAAMSPHHFAHVYKGYVGEPVMATVRRRRLRRAGADLARATDKISAVARTAGYSSGQAFARAYRRDAGVAPTAVRLAGKQAGGHEAASALRLVTLEDLPASGISLLGTFADEGAAFSELIGHGYADVALGSISRFRRSVRGFSVLSEGWPGIGQVRRRHATLIADGMPQRYTGHIVPRGRYAVLRHVGSLPQACDSVPATRERILREFDLKVTDAPMLCEWVSDAALLPGDQLILDIYFPVGS